MKKNYYYLSIVTIVMFFSMLFTSAFAKNEVVQLVCEYHTNPLGIDVQKPLLNWQISSAGEDLLQTAYEIRVADSPTHLSRKNKQIWTSGKVESAKSVDIIYEGPTLKSMQRVYWQVRIWDNKNKVTGWSNPAWWEMGILEPETWKASWVKIQSEKNIESPEPCQYFRKDFLSDKKIKSARVYVTSLGLYQLFLQPSTMVKPTMPERK